MFTQFAVPVAAVVVVAIVYTVNVPGMKAAAGIIEGYRAATPSDRYDTFVEVIEYNSFAQQEITEQLAQQAMSMAVDPNVPEEVRQKFITRSEAELNRLVEMKPGDARIHVFFGSFYRAINDLDKAEEQMKIARELSQDKQSIIVQQAVIKYSRGDLEGAKSLFKEAFLLDENNAEARGYYAALLFATGENEEARKLADSELALKGFGENQFLLNAANTAGEIPFLIDVYEVKVKNDPDDEQNWVSLSFLYLQNEQPDESIEALERSVVANPDFEKVATCFADNIKAGNDPQEGC